MGLTVKFKRRKKNSITLAKIINEQWILWALPWKPNNVLSLKLSESRRNLNLTSTNWKSLLTMPTRPTAKDKRLKRYQGTLRDTIQGYEDEARARQQVMEQVGISERKANALSGEVEESRALLDSAERAKRQLDSELADARNAVNEMGVINSRAMHDKRNVESMIHTLQAEIDDALAQAKNSEEKSKRAMVDAARLADELRSEQDHANAEGRGKRSLDTQLAELENRLAEAEA